MKKIIIAMLITMFFCTSANAKKRSGATITNKSGRIKIAFSEKYQTPHLEILFLQGSLTF
jgi:hypothetical protein